MKNYTIQLYEPKDSELWNAFTSTAKNATFLFNRDFMDYHSDRFNDYSLLVLEGQKWVAVLPANRVEKSVFSHEGLSYGNLVVQKNLRVKEYLAIFRTVLQFLYEQQIENLSIKLLPKIYNTTLSDEFDMVFFLTQAQMYRADIYLVLDNNQEYKPNRNRKRALKTAKNSGIEIKENQEYELFWNTLLIPNLKNRFNSKPVHSVAEICKLASLFPNNIFLFNAYQNREIKAGVVLFVTETVAHFQYSSGAEDRMETAALDLLFDFIIKKYTAKKFVSFGNVSEENGSVINEGLAYWKESFGALSTTQNYVNIATKNFDKLNAIVL